MTWLFAEQFGLFYIVPIEHFKNVYLLSSILFKTIENVDMCVRVMKV